MSITITIRRDQSRLLCDGLKTCAVLDRGSQERVYGGEELKPPFFSGVFFGSLSKAVLANQGTPRG